MLLVNYITISYYLIMAKTAIQYIKSYNRHALACASS